MHVSFQLNMALCMIEADHLQHAEQACWCCCRDEQQAAAHGMKRRYEGRHANDRFGEAFGPAKHRKGQGR